MTQKTPANKNTTKITAVMTPEMCRAIKRQETNAGIDYWKHAINNDRLHPTFRRLTQVNLDFPGIFLPNVQTTQSLRAKRRSQKPPTMVLGRSKTSLMPDIKSGRVSDANSKPENGDNTKKTEFADITCQQFADTLLTYNKSPFAGLFGKAVNQTRFDDYVTDENNNENNPDGTFSPEMTYNSFHNDGEKNSDDNSQTVHSDDNISPSILPQEMTSPSGQTSHGDHNDVKAKPQTKPQKSILKNGNPNTTIVVRPTSATSITETYSAANKPSVFSYQLPNSKTIRQSSPERRVPSGNMYPKIQNDLPVGYRHFRSVPIRNDINGTVRSIPIRIERQTTVHGSFNDISSRKRSVRFNAAHQVHEYTPCEPVRYC
ncbi:hypothetical protein ACF0H5_008365 [Mactra antiquata]